MKIKICSTLIVLFYYVGMAQSIVTQPENDNRNDAEHELIASIAYVEEDEGQLFDLGFDTYQYLPEDFDPFHGMIYPLEEICYIEEEEEIAIDENAVWFLY